MLKHENLMRLGQDDRALVPQDSVSHSSRSSAIGDGSKPKAIEYLNKNRNQQKESVKDFIWNARKILVSQIAINDKREETEKLEEFIIMEQEKLEEARKTFDEDKDKFKKYMSDLNEKTENTALQLKTLQQDKAKKI